MFNALRLAMVVKIDLKTVGNNRKSPLSNGKLTKSYPTVFCNEIYEQNIIILSKYSLYKIFFILTLEYFDFMLLMDYFFTLNTSSTRRN